MMFEWKPQCHTQTERMSILYWICLLSRLMPSVNPNSGVVKIPQNTNRQCLPSVIAMRWLKNIVQKRFLGRLLEDGSRSGGCLNALDRQAAHFATTKLPDTGKNDRTRGRVYTRVGVEYEPETVSPPFFASLPCPISILLLCPSHRV